MAAEDLLKIEITKNVSSLSNETIWNSLNQLFNKETQKISQKLVVLLRSHSQPRNSLDGDKKKDEQHILNIGQVFKFANLLGIIPYEIDKEEYVLREESRERKCQRLESCYYNCIRMRARANNCRSSCQKAFDPADECRSDYQPTTESYKRKCQRLQSCLDQCLLIRAGDNTCQVSCQKAFDPGDKCGKHRRPTKKAKRTTPKSSEGEHSDSDRKK